MSLVESEGHYVATGPMEISNMTEMKKAIEGENGAASWPSSIVNHFENLRNFAMENVTLKMPLGPEGSSGKLRLVFSFRLLHEMMFLK